MLFIGMTMISCSKEDPGSSLNGSIYGIVTDSETAEPIRGAFVELYILESSQKYSLLMSGVTYDDGHFQFDRLIAGKYKFTISYTGYEEKNYELNIKDKGTTKVDISMSRIPVGISVTTKEAVISEKGLTLYASCEYSNGSRPNEVGFFLGESSDPNQSGKCYPTDVGYKEFNLTISKPNPGSYYYQAYAKNKYGTVYGAVISISIKEWIEIGNLGIQMDDLSFGANWDTANRLCSNSRVGGFDDWRLPTIMECCLLYDNIKKLGINDNYAYWSSSLNYGEPYGFQMWSERYYIFEKSEELRVRAVRTIK